MKRIIYTKPDGSVSVVIPAPMVDETENEEQYISRIAAKDVPASATNVRIVDESEIPQDRTFRSAWVSNNGVIGHDMSKCIDIQKDKLRALREPKLAALDAAYMKALESGNSEQMQTIATKKQALRDVTSDPSLTSAKSPDDLKKIIPEILK